IFEKSFTTDAYGGLDGELLLPKDATLGQYQIQIPNRGGSAGSFRVEEYKKPEFEVKIVAPTEPIMLGEKISATITGKYYFGAPVTEAKVKYKVLRYDYSANWYPRGLWDWFYEPGYWWFAYDYAWYPGWRDWGCKRPICWWWGRSFAPPEVVIENEVPIGPDGTLKVDIDTALAKVTRGHTDHKYEITAEITDQSRRTIVGIGNVMVARKPFKVYAWLNRGHYRLGDVIEAHFSAQTLDNKPVKGKGVLKLFKITYDKDNKPVETVAQEWPLDTNEEGAARQQLKATKTGQYRISYKVTDDKQREIEGGYVFCITGEGFDGSQFRFNDIELMTDKREYKPGDNLQLMINTNRAASTVLLFVRPANGVYLAPKMLRMKGKSLLEQIEIAKKDMPNFFIEAVTVANGRIFSEMREVVVPPESRVLNVEVLPSAKEYKPGEQAKVKVKLTDITGKPIAGSSVITVYDKSVEYISGGSNVPEIKSFFWKWRRQHQPHIESNLQINSQNLRRRDDPTMSFLGVFGGMNDLIDADGAVLLDERKGWGGGHGTGRSVRAKNERLCDSKSQLSTMPEAPCKAAGGPNGEPADGPDGGPSQAQPTVRTNFADTAYWAATVNTDAKGTAEFDLKMPESLTTWKMKVWTMSSGTRVGQGDAEVVTTKNLIVRLQAPRFFMQKDEVVLSANVHNYLKTKKSVEVTLQLDGACLEAMTPLTAKIEVDSQGEKRVDWRVKVLAAGEPSITVKALTDEESDAMQMKFPAFIHGMSKMDSFAGNIRPDAQSGVVTFAAPTERIPAQSRLEARYSPTLAGAMVDALPYLVDYPYGCTEQTLSRFLPTVITQKVLQRMNINLKDVRDKITNLNAQEIGDDIERAKQWKRQDSNGFWCDARPRVNPVFDEAEVTAMAKAGIERLSSMQCADGGWGWFSGWGEQSYPHTTAYVVHGLQIARNNDVALPPGMAERGIEWLKNYQATQVTNLNRQKDNRSHKLFADNLDALVYMVLVDANIIDNEMQEFLYRDRNNLAVYSKAMFGLALQRQQQSEKLKMIMQNIDQFLVQDNENQTAYLKLPADNYWWHWYGSEYEAQGYYLKLLALTDPKSEKASRLVKYLINNRKHASYWNSTRDTAVCIEAIADYLKASGEDCPDMTLEIYFDHKKLKEVQINATNLFSFDNKLVLIGEQIAAGKHTLEFKKKGVGPLYFNVYNSYFTLEDDIGKTGLEIKVDRKYYKLERVDKQVNVSGARGQAVGQKVEKYERQELKNLATLKSGDLVEIELEIESKNDYEYIMFEDMKAAGFEPVEVRSGYNNNDMGAYMELRDERVCFFVRQLARGKHSVAYRMRAEIPGKFSALPTRVSAMYAPELRANSDEIKLHIQD
ncbi:MAG: alpha-2-macroglobulin family protein, partial [Planctomycetota bacterium]